MIVMIIVIVILGIISGNICINSITINRKKELKTKEQLIFNSDFL